MHKISGLRLCRIQLNTGRMQLHTAFRRQKWKKMISVVWFGLFRIFGEAVAGWKVLGKSCVLSRCDYAKTQQIEVCAAIHGSFDQFESLHISFNRPVAPAILKSRLNGCFVATQVFGERG